MIGKTFFFFTAAMDPPSVSSAEFVFFVLFYFEFFPKIILIEILFLSFLKLQIYKKKNNNLSQAHKIIWVAHKLTRSVGNWNQIYHIIITYNNNIS